MKINGTEGLSGQQLVFELQHGARFVIFQYTISILVLTFRRGSDIYFVRAGESAALKGLPYTLLSLLAGWWGIPWGPIYTIGSVFTNLGGGRDVTSEVQAALRVA